MINKKANNHKMSIVNGFINIGTFILLFLLPVSCIITVAIKQEYLILNPLNWLWAGFYGSVLNIFLIKRKLLKQSNGLRIILSMVNMAFILLALYVSLIGGLQGIIWFLFMVIFPYINKAWMWEIISTYLPVFPLI